MRHQRIRDCNLRQLSAARLNSMLKAVATVYKAAAVPHDRYCTFFHHSTALEICAYDFCRMGWVGHGQSAGALTACKFSWRCPSYMIIFLLLTFGLMCTFQVWSVFIKKVSNFMDRFWGRTVRDFGWYLDIFW